MSEWGWATRRKDMGRTGLEDRDCTLVLASSYVSIRERGVRGMLAVGDLA